MTGAGPACGVDDGEGDYLNCPLTRDEYEAFYKALTSAESATVHDFDKERFFAFTRKTYWGSPEGSPSRDLMQTLIGKLDF